MKIKAAWVGEFRQGLLDTRKNLEALISWLGKDSEEVKVYKEALAFTQRAIERLHRADVEVSLTEEKKEEKSDGSNS